MNWDHTEVIFEGRPLTGLLVIGFVGGLAAGAIGLGGGSIYNPALLALAVAPKVAGATGMYLVMFSTFNACVVNAINGTLDLKYGAFLGACNVVGSLIGLILADYYIKKTGR